MHLAALLLHLSQGAAMRLQYRLVVHTKAQQLALRQRRGAEVADVAEGRREQQQGLADLAAMLDDGLDWQAVQQLGGAAAAPAAQGGPAGPSGRSKRAGAGAGAGRSVRGAGASTPPDNALATLEMQAEQALRRWLAALPSNTPVCSLAVSYSGASVVVCRLDPGGALPVVVSLPAPSLSASLSRHPIRALSMDDEPGNSSGMAASR